MSNILKGLHESRSDWDNNMSGYRGDYGGAENWDSGKKAFRRQEADQEWEREQEYTRQREQQQAELAQYNATGKFWLKLKDSQRHLPAGPFIGKQTANKAAVDLLQKQPELKGNLVITAYGPDEQVNELSNNTLASYKKKAGADASAADKAGDYKRGDKRFSGIVKATKKEFDNDAKGVDEGIMNKIANKVMGAAPEQPQYKVGQRVKYETSPHQPDWADGGSGVGVITAYKNGHYMINGNPVNHFEIKGVVEQGVAEGSGTTPKITFAQQTPGSWTRIDILVDGDVKFQAVKTMGPGHWTIHDQDGEVIGDGGNKTELKASVLNYLSKQGVAEGSEQIYNILALDKGNALKKPTKLKWKASSLEDIFDALAAQDWYPLEINGVEVIAGKRLKQGVAEGPEFDKWADERAASQLHKLKPATLWEVSFDYGPHQSDSVKVNARSAQEAVDKVETAAEKKGRSIMVNWARPAEQGIEEEKQRLDPSCWKGYKKQGTKMKGDTRVNNCVPVKESAIMKGLK